MPDNYIIPYYKTLCYNVPMFNFLNKFRLAIILVIFISLIFILGLVIGRNYSFEKVAGATSLNIVNNDAVNFEEDIDMEAFWKVWNLLDEKFVATKKQEATTTNQDRIWGAIQGMTDSLKDPYTVFMPPEDSKDFTENINGNFEGVGMEIGEKDGILTVISPLKGSPAELAGIKAGDKIITINSTPSANMPSEKAVKLIRGPKGTAVKLSILRNGNNKAIDFEIIRAVIDIPSIKTEIKGDVFVISLYNFYAQSRVQFNKALKEFVNSGTHKLILDLRNNPGGYLDTSIDMASWFLPLGKPVVLEDFGNKKENVVHRSKGYDIFNDNLKMVILVNNGSASASEILAGALQEYNIAKLVGVKTYGKGSVQELVKVTPETSLKVTIAKWLTPNGKSISEGGLTPDYEVKISEADAKAEKDPQMDKALELLK
jgi:carboxyl-terminal processing protease